MSREVNFDEDIRREQEIKRLLIDDEMDYWIGNPVVQIIHGQLILDKDSQNSLAFNASIESLASQRIKIALANQDRGFNSLVAFGIQNSKSPVEISEFFKELPFSNGIAEIRVIKTSSNIMYGMILFFLSNEQCHQFLQKNFGQRFNTIEDDIILLRPIMSITFSLDAYDIKNEEESLLFSRHSSKSSNSTASHNTTTQSSTTQINPSSSSPQVQSQVNPQQQLCSSTLSLTFNIMQTDNNQVINCAICQDPLIVTQKDIDSPKKSGKTLSLSNQDNQDEEQSLESSDQQNVLSPIKQISQKKNLNDQILSIMCGHYFHSACLSRWQDSICPLCRYHQQPPELSYCDVCRSSEALWMCLICGSKNCGMEFMTSSHVKMHYEESKHTYSMEIESKFVYDHSRDSFVHRLMQNLADGKIVEVDSGNQNTESMNSSEYDKGKKSFDSLKEYEIQMSTGLEAQRKEYQAKLLEIKKLHTKKLQEQEQRKKEALINLQLEKQLLEKEEIESKLEESQLNEIKQLFLQLSTKRNELLKVESTLSQKHQVLGQSSEKQEETLKKKLSEIKQEIEAKIQEIKDIETHLKSNKKLKESGVDTSNSALLVLGSSNSHAKKKKKKK